MADQGIAIIGLACRIGAASSAQRFWEALCAGEELVRDLGQAELLDAGVPESDLAHSDYVRRRGVLDDVGDFAAEFFGYAPREAQVMDPQHRLFLECAWTALEDAGHDPSGHSGHSGLVGVFGAASTNTYRSIVDRYADLARTTGVIQADLGCEVDYLATRVSYKLDLRGPSVSVQTACSSSLVAVHMACQSLLGHECDTALAGGVAIQLPQVGYRYREGGIGSADGRCRPFDAAAGGTVGGDGVGVVVLKRLADAIADGDDIRAVVLGSAVNNDGSSKVGFTAPSARGQTEVIVEAQAVAGVKPRDIEYVEGHGTGTALGDPIEVRALTRAFRADTADRGFCALGSVKANTGHLDAAAGMAGLIKATLALRHRLIPPTPHFRLPNPACELPTSPFHVNTEPLVWASAGDRPRVAGVSAFGIGGTNAHLVLGEAPARAPGSAGRPGVVLVSTAKTPSALRRACDELTTHLAADPVQDIADVAHTLQVGREHFDHRQAVVRFPGRADEVVTGSRRDSSVLMLFPGQGAQHPGMAAGLYRTEPVFRDWVDHCCDLLVPELGRDLRPPLLEGDVRALEPTWLAQPAIFVTTYALVRLWQAWGVDPAAMIGHSLGEYVAACLAGVFDLPDALRLVAARGRLMGDTPPGTMVSVRLPAEALVPLLPEGAELASVNGPAHSVATGGPDAIAALRDRLSRDGVPCRPLRTAHAFHSASQEPAVAKLVDLLAGIGLRPPTRPYLSTATGDWITQEQATDPTHWGRQARDPVLFSAALRRVLAEGLWTVLEVGPGTGLTTLVRQHTEAAGHHVVSSMRRPEDTAPDRAVLLRATAKLWAVGVPLDWRGFAASERRRKVPLPTYPFERGRYWAGEEIRHQATGGPTATGAAGPQDPVQARVAAIWRDVIGVDRPGPADDFFELGGSSLVATQVAGRLGDVFDVDVPLAMIFERTTLAALAEGVEGLLLDRIEAIAEEPT
ncbi:acyl transferase domain-containing protein [Actinokineospora baliensis]|uniref:type I polyketide synthase n=1 Tax=Actinokineospora baliensis TaxID=547056 RepID=UPI00195AD16C|nr:type I polyketide synthase [Actinokineospora baliensis]MBM7774665.1 acyl transferase domain-containing protein [Actinokineospora baliensis]